MTSTRVSRVSTSPTSSRRFFSRLVSRSRLESTRSGPDCNPSLKLKNQHSKRLLIFPLPSVAPPQPLHGSSYVTEESAQHDDREHLHDPAIQSVPGEMLWWETADSDLKDRVET